MNVPVVLARQLAVLSKTSFDIATIPLYSKMAETKEPLLPAPVSVWKMCANSMLFSHSSRTKIGVSAIFSIMPLQIQNTVITGTPLFAQQWSLSF